MTVPETNINREHIFNVLRRFKELNAERYHIISLGFFGSGARDQCNEKSDVDVVVVLNEPDIFRLIGIKQDLEEEFQCHVDIVRYRERMNPFLRRRIEREAIYV